MREASVRRSWGDAGRSTASHTGGRAARLTPAELATFLDRTLARLGEDDARRLAIAQAFRHELEHVLSCRSVPPSPPASRRPAPEVLRRRVAELEWLLARGVAAADATIAAYRREVAALRARLTDPERSRLERPRPSTPAPGRGR